MKMNSVSRFWMVVLLVAAVCLPAAHAAAPLASAQVTPGGMEWQPAGSYEKMTLTVSGPDGLAFRREFAAGVIPSFDSFAGKPLADGTYTWELSASPILDRTTREALAAARQAGDDTIVAKLRAKGKLPQEPLVQSGSFQVSGGFITPPVEREERGGKPARGQAKGLTPNIAEDQVIPDDLIVQGSTCVGFDCVNNESFGFDTIRLKENNTRIKFEDTSVGTFPTNDWQLTANDSASGGANKFSIEDITGSKVPFTVTAGAATNSIFVDSTGRVGLRTSTPVLDLHINTRNTPAIRLEQNNSGGFTAQTWDVAGNEANFFVRDVTGGSRLPFRIRPGAPTSSIDISTDGDVGIGTASPSEKLHVSESVDANTFILVQNANTGTTAAAVLRASSDTAQVNFQAHSSTRTISRFGKVLGGWDEMLAVTGNGLAIGTLTAVPLVLGTNNANRIEIASTGAVTVAGNLTVNGVFSNPSSREFKEAFKPMDARTVLAKFATLPIQEWTYKSDERKLRHVGPTVEDFQSAFGLGTEGRYIFPMDVQGVTMAAVQGLYELVQEKDAQIAQLQKRLDTEMAELRALLEKSQKQ